MLCAEPCQHVGHPAHAGFPAGSAFWLVGVWMAMSFELTMRGVLFLVRLVRGRWLDKGALA